MQGSAGPTPFFGDASRLDTVSGLLKTYTGTNCGVWPPRTSKLQMLCLKPWSLAARKITSRSSYCRSAGMGTDERSAQQLDQMIYQAGNMDNADEDPSVWPACH